MAQIGVNTAIHAMAVYGIGASIKQSLKGSKSEILSKNVAILSAKIENLVYILMIIK
tara:strand:+ start:437 stop:607 length:171 start_codon:yes stop_codon:yes gene_type:complete